jgi:hypothetical protein
VSCCGFGCGCVAVAVGLLAKKRYGDEMMMYVRMYNKNKCIHVLLVYLR